MKKTFFLILTISALLNAEITLKDISSKPTSRAKDFMIWQYMKQDITASKLEKAYSQIETNSYKLNKIYLKKTKNKKVRKNNSCKNRKDLLEIKDSKCLEQAITPYKTLVYNNKQRLELIKKITKESTKNLLMIQNEPYNEEMFKKYNSNTILTALLNTTSKHRAKNLNINFSSEFINSLSSSSKISQLVRIVVFDKKLDKLQTSFLNLNGKNLDSKTNFLLALNHLKHNSENGAIKHFQLAKDKARRQMNIDKNNFWLYKLTNKKTYLDDLLLSMDINIYTIYAKEISKIKISNYFSVLSYVDGKNKKDITNPFDWRLILKEIKSTPKEKLFELAKSYNQKEMLSVQAFIKEKAFSFKYHGYIMPYDKYLVGLTNDEKALVYSLMRQESNLIPSALSRSYALGLMQLMPFLTDAISKNIKNPIKTYSEMFIPKNNIRYALAHIKWMEKSLYHPLFMAYAYNGGMGFFKRHLLNTKAFSKGKYEPYLSMEFIQNIESREYGKKVLANYIIYKKILKEDVSIVSLLEKTLDPKMSDRFRVFKN